MIPFKGTKWNYSSSNKSSLPPSLTDTHNYSDLMGSKRKADKMKDIESSDLMHKLEKFSDVWNDCPNVDNPILRYDYKSKEERRSYYDNKVSENKLVSKTTYSSEVTDQLNSHSEERKKSRRNDKQITLNLNQPNNFHLNKANIDVPENDSSKPSPSNDGEYHAKKADLKRKKAVLKQQQLHVDQKNTIKQALSSLDSNNKVNKKIVFNNDDEEDVHDETELEETSLKSKRQKLFDDDDDEDNSKLELDVDFKLNHQFEGKKGQKLLELQSKFSSDSRFTLDKRFYESGSEEENNRDGTEEEPSASDEKTKQLAILESIVKQQIRPLSDQKKLGPRFDDKLLLRFDPTREDHVKYVINQQEKPTKHQEKVTKKKEKRKDVEENNPETTKPEVSKEKFVSVRENLKEVLAKDSGFSLLNLFGPKEEESDDEPEGKPQKIKKPRHATKNPFKYDSSDSEHEEEAEMKKGKDTEQSVEPKNTVSWRTNFFFTENDPRFQEAFEFLKYSEEKEDNNDYAEKRKLLKDFIRNKYKNSIRKNSSFKKKLGGLKKKPFVKRKVKKS